jgi:hypothetical protein
MADSRKPLGRPPSDDVEIRILSMPELHEGHIERPGPWPDHQGGLRGWQGAASSIIPSITSLPPETEYAPWQATCIIAFDHGQCMVDNGGMKPIPSDSA